MPQIAILQHGLDVYDLGLNPDEGDRLTLDPSLRTAFLISLLTERRCEPSEALDAGDLRGWWGDTYQDAPGDFMGSRLWTLQGAKDIPQTRSRAEQYIREALQWSIDDGICSRIDIELESVSATVLGADISVVRPAQPAPEWVLAWKFSV